MAFSFLLYTWIMSPTNPTTLPWNSHCYMLSLGSYNEDNWRPTTHCPETVSTCCPWGHSVKITDDLQHTALKQSVHVVPGVIQWRQTNDLQHTALKQSVQLVVPLTIQWKCQQTPPPCAVIPFFFYNEDRFMNPTPLPWNSQCYMLMFPFLYNEDGFMNPAPLPWNS